MAIGYRIVDPVSRTSILKSHGAGARVKEEPWQDMSRWTG